MYLAAALAAAALAWGLAGCTDASRSKIMGYGSQFQVTLYACDGSVIREWTSSGKVKSEETSDGYYFMDKGSGRLIEVTGTLVIEKLD
ncbi:MAG: hypothetical protein ACE5E8_07765 [Acidimicrobiia bacterium]